MSLLSPTDHLPKGPGSLAAKDGLNVLTRFPGVTVWVLKDGAVGNL